jgi:hypothetical protein
MSGLAARPRGGHRSGGRAPACTGADPELCAYPGMPRAGGAGAVLVLSAVASVIGTVIVPRETGSRLTEISRLTEENRL